MATILVKCPNGHRFPVNPKKHLNRREKYCPRCKAPVNVRPKFWFLPNPSWLEQREIQASERQHIRRMARAPTKQPTIVMPSAADLLMLSLALKTQIEEEKKKKEEKD